jgi:2-deoxy-D-gluconate 3-dehydrogenase
MADRFQDKRVFVTGAAQGIGRAISAAFLQEGARVCMTDLNGEGVAATASELADDGRAVPMQLDVTDRSAVHDSVGRAIEELGGIDILVNNAGVITMKPTVELTEEEWDLNMDVNAKGVFLCTQAVLPHMLERGDGCVVSTASQAGKRGYKLFSHYCASKAAVINFTRAVGIEWARSGVQVNAIAPGYVETEMNAELRSDPDTAAKVVGRIPARRMARAPEIAQLVLDLASPRTDYMVGETVVVDGGESIR